jgi:hypothetical protein
MFERVKPRGQLSARELREAGQVLESVPARAAEGSEAVPHQSPGGTAWLAEAAGFFVARVTHVVTGSPGDPVKYGFLEVWGTPSTGVYAAKTGSERKSDGTKNYALAVPGMTYAVDDYVLARRHPQNANLYEILTAVGGGSTTAAARGKVRGKLDGSLSFGGSAAMSVWAWDGAADADTTENLTVYDWLLSSGQSVAAGTQVTAFYDVASGRWYLDGAQCP